MPIRIILLPTLTKIDLANARSLDVILSLLDLFHFDPNYILNTSARNRIGIEEVLDVISRDVPSPLEYYNNFNQGIEDGIL